MSSTTLLKCVAAGATGCFLEHKYGGGVGNNRHDKLFVLTPAILLGTSFWTLAHGFTVGRARAKYMELAEKDGEKDVKERYGLPNLYAQGTSKHARAFNAVQRSHQHIFETTPLAILSGIMGAWTFPITSACATLMYATGRYVFSVNYASSEGNATKRYSSPVARYMWYGLLVNTTAAFASCIMVLIGKKKLM